MRKMIKKEEMGVGQRGEKRTAANGERKPRGGEKGEKEAERGE